ncbi:MAG: heme exporter protein CcmB [Gammaproteobacteria bacterium RBG_16_57_12]|nr:MAG: heme exporter protein CcmB [Gammaproteobacteria bacterium RBG_16_57_12]
MWRGMLQRELTLALRRPQDVLTSLIFFVIVVSLFPLGVSPQLSVLQGIAPGVIWVAALLANMLSLSRLFSDDFRDGTLEQMLIAPQPLSLVVFSKIFAHWLLSGVPLVLISPLLGMQLGLAGDPLKMLMLTLLLGTPVLSLIGAIGAALTLGVRGGGVLLSLLILPLYVPVLIFATGAVDAVGSGFDADAQVSLLAAFLVLALCFAPWAAAAALRIMME